MHRRARAQFLCTEASSASRVSLGTAWFENLSSQAVIVFCIGFLCLCSVVSQLNAMAVSLILLEIPSVTGDSTIGSYRGMIVVESFSWGVGAELVAQVKGEQRTAIKAKVFRFKKQFDRASTVLYTMMNSDKKFEATLRFIDPSTTTKSGSMGGAKIDAMLEIQLQRCRLTSISLSASDSGKAVSVSEDIELSFKELSISYRRYDQASHTRVAAITSQIELPDEEDN